MIKHLFKLIWNKKRQYALLGLEILISFFILLGISTYLIYNYQLYSEPLGYDTEKVLVADISPAEGIDSLILMQNINQLKKTIQQLPGIASVAIGSSYPMSGSSSTTNSDDNGFQLKSQLHEADEGFLETMELSLIEGEWFNTDNQLGKNPPVVVNKKFKEAYYPNENILGKILKIGTPDDVKIIGVVDHYKYKGAFDEEPNGTFHVLQKKYLKHGFYTYIKLKENTPLTYEATIDETIRSSVKDWSFEIVDLNEVESKNKRETWVFMLIILSISIFLIFNVALGLFGVVWYNTSKRKGEIGLRRALGATTSSISRHFIGENFVIASMAILLGLFFAIQLPYFQLFEMELSIYLKGIVCAIVFIYGLVFLCSFIPSRQAAEIHPATALHEE